jgi:DNA-binding NarL/FixJ family response regulator
MAGIDNPRLPDITGESRSAESGEMPAPGQVLPLRVVIAGADGTAASALQCLIERIPGVAVITRLADLASAWAHCASGDTDVFIVDATQLEPSRAGLPFHDIASVARLSARERQIFEMLVTGPSNRQLARTLGITERTVKAHITAIMTKLGLRSRLQVGLAAQAQHARAAASPRDGYLS